METTSNYNNNWVIEEGSFDPALAGYYETIFTLANGYMGIRGTIDCTSAICRKGTFLAGVFDKGDAQITEIVNCPSFMNFHITVDEEAIDLEKCREISYRRWLDMKKALLHMDVTITDHSCRKLDMKCTKAVSTADKRIALFTIEITPLNFSGLIKVSSEIDGTASNYDRSGCREIRHFKVTEGECSIGGAAALQIETLDNKTRMNIATCMGLRGAQCDSCCGSDCDAAKETPSSCSSIKRQGDKVISEVAFACKQGTSYTIDKVICVLHSFDLSEVSTPERAAEYACSRFKTGVPDLLQAHIEVMAEKWDMSDIGVEGDNKAQVAIRFNILNLMMLGANVDGNVSIGAKGLHGEGYKGHVFWDTEIFVLPFYIYNQPMTAKKLLLYRYNRLDAAKANARAGGYDGARFPWESADTGIEATPDYFYPKEGEPIKCLTGDEEIHITADVAFAFYEYCRITADVEFFLKYCAEVLIETAKFWVSRLEYNSIFGYYEIKSVIGPDEYHVHVNNNCYINYLARWNIFKAAEVWDELRSNYAEDFEAICRKTNVNEESINQWKEKSSRILVKYSDNGILEQFDGYFSLKDYIIEKYNQKGMPVLPPNFKGEKDFWGYRLIKQADVVMLLHLFNDQFSEEQKKINYEYYEKRTIHWSSLSPSIYSLMGVNVKVPSKAYSYFNVSANTDIDDNQSNTEDGIHAAAVGGTWQAMVLGFGGFRVKEDIVHLDPWLPEEWKGISYKANWKGKTISVSVTREHVKVIINGSDDASYELVIFGKQCTIEVNVKLEVQMPSFLQ